MKHVLAVGRIRPDNVIAIIADLSMERFVADTMTIAERDDSHVLFHLPVGSMEISEPTNLVIQTARRLQ